MELARLGSKGPFSAVVVAGHGAAELGRSLQEPREELPNRTEEFQCKTILPG